MRKPRQSFTLLEMLVVMAIVATLAGLTFVFARQAIQARERMRCLNSLRQWTIALEMYANEHTGYYPPSGELFNRTPAVGLFMTNYLQIVDTGNYREDHLPIAMCKSGIARFSTSSAFVGWSLFAGYEGPTPLQNDYAGANFADERNARDSGLALIACLTAGSDALTWSGHGVGGQSATGPEGQVAAWPDGHARWVRQADLKVAVTKNVPFVGPVPYYMPAKDL